MLESAKRPARSLSRVPLDTIVRPRKVGTPRNRSRETTWAATSAAIHAPHSDGASGPARSSVSANALRSTMIASAIPPGMVPSRSAANAAVDDADQMPFRVGEHAEHEPGHDLLRAHHAGAA